MIREFIFDALLLATWATVVPLLAAAAAGLMVAILQAVTQVQESTTVYLAKLAGLTAALVLCWNPIGDAMHELMIRLGQIIAQGGGEFTW